MRIYLNLSKVISLVAGLALAYTIAKHTYLIYSLEVAKVSVHVWSVNSAQRAAFFYWLSAALISLAIFLIIVGSSLEGTAFYSTSPRPCVYGFVGSSGLLLILVFFLSLIGGDFPPYMEKLVTSFSLPIYLSLAGGGEMRKALAGSAALTAGVVIIVLVLVMTFLALRFYGQIEIFETTYEEEEAETEEESS